MSTFQVQAKDAIYSINDMDTVNAMQNFNWDPAFNEELTEELGNAGYSSQSISPELSGSFDVNATGSTVALLSRMIQDLDGSGNFLGYKFNVATPNAGTIRHTDLEYAVFDLIGKKKENEIFTRSEFFPRVFLSTMNFSGDANGNASESYSFEGQFMDIYRGDYRDIISKPATRTTATTATLVDTDFRLDLETPTNGTTPTHTIIAVQVNEDVYTEGAGEITAVSDSVGAGPAIITFTGVTLPAGARIMVWAYKITPGTFPVVYNPTSARFVRANQIDIWIVKQSTVDISALADGALMTQSFTDSDAFLRVQSFDLSVDLRREVLRQIKKTDNLSSIYYRAATYPLNITASANTFESDLDDWRRLVDATAVPASAADTLNLADFDGKEFQLVIRYYYNGTAIQTMAFTDARVTGMSMSNSVGGRGEVSWSFTGSEIVIEGANV